MSAVNNNNSTPGASSSNSTNNSSTPGLSGFANLTTADFMKMLIAELKNQDPTQPMSNQDLLTQLSTMSQLQSTTDLDSALQTNTNNQQLSIAASLIGKAVQGIDSSNASTTGVVSEAFIQNGTTYVQVGNSTVPLANITAVASPQ